MRNKSRALTMDEVRARFEAWRQNRQGRSTLYPTRCAWRPPNWPAKMVSTAPRPNSTSMDMSSAVVPASLHLVAQYHAHRPAYRSGISQWYAWPALRFTNDACPKSGILLAGGTFADGIPRILASGSSTPGPPTSCLQRRDQKSENSCLHRHSPSKHGDHKSGETV